MDKDEVRAPLVDSFGRIATDLRVSVTDRCNFRCRYCMPPEGLPWLPKDELLSFEEIARLTRILAQCGVRSLKVTGGEPLVRRDLHLLVRRLRAIDETLDISLTTNGSLLAGQAQGLADAGLDRVTVSVDSLLRHRFTDMTLRDELDQVMRGIETAAAAGLTPVKINTVVIRGQNEDEVLDFARLARRTGYDIRFIEYMPLDAQERWNVKNVVPGREVIERISQTYPLSRAPGENVEPASPYVFSDGAPGRIGIIPSVTEPFCSSCNRLRLTADGHLRACLFSLEETDLRTPLRGGADDDEIADLAHACVAAKWAGHRIGEEDFVQPARSMSMIGG